MDVDGVVFEEQPKNSPGFTTWRAEGIGFHIEVYHKQWMQRISERNAWSGSAFILPGHPRFGEAREKAAGYEWRWESLIDDTEISVHRLTEEHVELGWDYGHYNMEDIQEAATPEAARQVFESAARAFRFLAGEPLR